MKGIIWHEFLFLFLHELFCIIYLYIYIQAVQRKSLTTKILNFLNFLRIGFNLKPLTF